MPERCAFGSIEQAVTMDLNKPLIGPKEQNLRERVKGRGRERERGEGEREDHRESQAVRKSERV